MTDLLVEPASGYVTLWPFCDHGEDKARAAFVAGVRVGQHNHATCKQYVAINDAKQAFVLHSKEIATARLEAISRSGTSPITIAERIMSAERPVYKKLEVITKDDKAQFILSPSGQVVSKALNPKNPWDFRNLINRLAGGLRTKDHEFAKPHLQQYFDRLNVDWPNLTKRQIAQVLSDARAYLGTLPIDPLLGVWEQRISVDVTVVGNGVRKVIRDHYLPSTQLSMNLVEREAVADIARQPGFFVRDEFGKRSKIVTERSRKIIERGLEQGFGREQIGKLLMESGNGYWQQRGLAYARTVAANVVSRARSFVELSSYREAGIEVLEVQAVLDERTTDICFCAGTNILTPRGERPIENLSIGDIVITGFGLMRPITNTFVNKAKGVHCIKLWSGRQMMVTGRHPILTLCGWVRAENLAEGDVVISRNRCGVDKLEAQELWDAVKREGRRYNMPEDEIHPLAYLLGGRAEMIIGTEYIPSDINVFNIEVEEDHTYIAENIIVHNCRCLDGTIVRVSDASEQFRQLNGITEPGQIRDVAPFMRTRVNQETGNKEVLTGRGNVMAEITRSGFGVADDRGNFNLKIGGNKLIQEGASMPPYHHNCRSYTVPRTKMISVPAGKVMRTYSTPVTQPIRVKTPAQRPPRIINSPSPARPVSIINTPPGQTGFKFDPKDISKAMKSVAEIVDQYMGNILGAISSAMVVKGSDLTQEETGRMLRALLLRQNSTEFSAGGVISSKPDLTGLDGKTFAVDQRRVWKKGLQFSSKPLRRKLFTQRVPSIRRGVETGYHKERELIVIRTIADEGHLIKTIQEFVDTLGDTGLAGVLMRNDRAIAGKLSRVALDGYAFEGPWIDIYDGRVWHSDSAWLREQYNNEREFTQGEISRMFSRVPRTALWSQIGPRFLRGNEIALSETWERFPEQVAGYMAAQAGDFLGISDDK